MSWLVLLQKLGGQDVMGVEGNAEIITFFKERRVIIIKHILEVLIIYFYIGIITLISSSGS